MQTGSPERTHVEELALMHLTIYYLTCLIGGSVTDDAVDEATEFEPTVECAVDSSSLQVLSDESATMATGMGSSISLIAAGIKQSQTGRFQNKTLDWLSTIVAFSEYQINIVDGWMGGNSVIRKISGTPRCAFITLHMR